MVFKSQRKVDLQIITLLPRQRIRMLLIYLFCCLGNRLIFFPGGWLMLAIAQHQCANPLASFPGLPRFLFFGLRSV